MSEVTKIVERYLEIWNEPDAQARTQQIRDLCQESIVFTDPMADVSGHEAFNALIGAVQQQFPGMVFTLAGAVDAHHDLARFTWGLAPAGADEPLAIGFDVIKVGSDGRLATIYGFLDKLPG
ncbi:MULTISPECIES: nuclear transport factor 2 family protein [unclassified Solwaraspora]|uniref:nuclear transport factor 2 family protein n=1 Tax=unclassified Solwaraspora TaxID=2627926 RepID=UPI00248C434C|nr:MULTISPECIES: nuclear transport factor 2 family protein [unclassified Solwaraspora]WBB95632.1 nuclear transport factor 2 family protein [Solwaraspora sp. WMMA2059]WBC20464.1 nuclear transport factor 2 family protein [Solwaraspora sp. WMMA2080]WJK37383.1 nuclear transport factor 2 family protein [Solwaraspora sp. WMMA2065]